MIRIRIILRIPVQSVNRNEHRNSFLNDAIAVGNTVVFGTKPDEIGNDRKKSGSLCNIFVVLFSTRV